MPAEEFGYVKGVIEDSLGKPIHEVKSHPLPPSNFPQSHYISFQTSI